MKIRQNVRHFAAKKALELPVLRDVAHEKLVDLHVDIFIRRADEADRAERRDHLEAFFDGTIDLYLAALQAGHSEAVAREITHVVANFDFYDHGWTEMMEFPGDEVEEHYERYADFFDAHGIEIDDPLGEFVPDGGVPDAPATSEKLDAGDFDNADAGYADDVYVETGEGDLTRGGQAEPEDVDVADAPGMGEE